jgi:dihydroorotase
LYDLIVHGRILKDDGLIESSICIKDGIIEDIRRSLTGVGQAGEIINTGKSLILPGAIDLHTHMRDPGLERKEDFFTGTLSAAFGGVTSIVDMPNTKPATSDIGSFSLKKSIAERKSYVDFGLNMVIMDTTDFELIPGIIKDPAFSGFKVFLGETTGSLVLKDIGTLSRYRDILGNIDKPISVHAEDGSLINSPDSSAGNVLRRHLESRPSEAEALAIRRINSVMKEKSNLLHFLHISSSEGIHEALKTASTIEVTPHHLLLDVKNCEKQLEEESFGKVNPPLRKPSDRASLWEKISDGGVYTIGSDHAPHEIKEKTSEDPPSGIPGVETMLPLMLWQVKKRRLSLTRLIELLSENPAKRIGLERRGSITPGNIADLAIIDMNSETRILGENLHSKCGWTPYEGFKGIFPNKVISRGELIIEDEQPCLKAGRGKPIRL